METIGQRIKQVRQERGVSQRDAARAIGVSQSSYSDLERGATEGRAYDLLVRIARHLQVSTDYLLGVEDEAKKRVTLAGLTPLESELLELTRGMQVRRRRTLLRVARSLQEEEAQERRYDELVAAIEQIDHSGLLARAQERLSVLMRETGSMAAAVNTLAAELASAGTPLAPEQGSADTFEQ